MSGIQFIDLYERLKEEAVNLGFKITRARHHCNNFDVVALIPGDDDRLPIYSRDAELFRGSLEELEIFFKGIQWARTYDKMLKVSSDKTRQSKEEIYRHGRLVKVLANKNKEA